MKPTHISKHTFSRLRKGLIDYISAVQQVKGQTLKFEDCFNLEWISENLDIVFDFRFIGKNGRVQILKELQMHGFSIVSSVGSLHMEVPFDIPLRKPENEVTVKKSPEN